MAHIDNEWQEFLKQNREFSVMTPMVPTFEEEEEVEEDEEEVDDEEEEEDEEDDEIEENKEKEEVRKTCEDLYISTQTKIFFLSVANLPVDDIFWNTQVIPYTTRSNGVIKKQIRFISKNREEFQTYIEKRDKELFFTEKIMKQIDNPNARKIKFKDVRKLTVGISKKDIMNCHGKNKNAFINCFAMILRVLFDGCYYEMHVKVFNTGRMAIPGIVNDGLLEETKKLLLATLQSNFAEPIMLISGMF
jgi:hypothetical protein